MLQIPPHKTLLRRHLSTNFNNLLGPDIINHKRDILSQPYVTYLSPSLRIKVYTFHIIKLLILLPFMQLASKKGFSATRKKSKTDIIVDPDIRVCPSSSFPIDVCFSNISFEVKSLLNLVIQPSPASSGDVVSSISFPYKQ